MWIYVVIIATVLLVTLWCMNNGAASKYNGYGLECMLAEHLDKSSIRWREELSM